ncbi:DUF4179 domain-containing protein [Paenibacillus solani]|uniref:DUF4179 domain-containing protein n=1 Tax=Paenibacillus solani TaxID=1705565 RepID=A0A0M1P586_9BACL|nr:DUF4179 domain-containing protein [Paenibacillus solani]KOR89562.1 hypothetical protein AM231_10710 [Paenibacillus solani]
MNSPEEQTMYTEAAMIRQEQKQHLQTIDATYAIQRGLAMGRNRRKTRAFSIKVAAISLTMIMAAGLLLFNPIKDTFTSQTVQTAPEQTLDWGALNDFKQLAVHDIDRSTLESAIRNDYIQMVNQSAKSGPYEITINAVTADENKLILLYTGTSDSSQEIYSVSSVRLTDAQTGRYLGNTSKIGSSADSQSWQGRATLELDRNDPLPDRIEADFQIASVDPGKLSDPKTGTVRSEMNYSERMKIEFDLDSKFSSIKTETYKPDQIIMLGGHQVLLSKVEISPLMTKASFVFDPGKKNDFQTRISISDMLNPYEIVSKTADRRVFKSSRVSGSGTKDGIQYIFGSNMLDAPQSIVMKLYPEFSQSFASVQEAKENALEFIIK